MRNITFSGFIEPLKKQPLIGIKVGIYSAVTTLFGLFSIIVVQWVTHSLQLKDYNLLITIIWIFSALIIVEKIFEYTTHTWYASRPKLGYDMRKIIYEKYIPQYIYLNNTKAEKVGTGNFIAIIQNGVNNRSEMLVNGIKKGTALIVNVVFTVYMISLTSWWYVLFFVGIIIVVQLLFKLINDKFVVPLRFANVEAQNSYSRYLVKIIMSKFEILQSGKVNQETTNLYEKIDDIVSTNCNINKALVFMFNIPPVFFYSLYIFTFYFVGKSVISGEVVLETFVGYVLLINYLRSTVSISTESYKDFTRDIPYVQKLRQIFEDLKDKNDLSLGGKLIEISEGIILLDNISFSYDENKSRYVLKDFNLKLNGGQKTAIVGKSGSGKTTILKLIAGYMQPDNGEIYVDGNKFSEINMIEYYKQIGYLTQDPSVFDGTILENLVYALDHIPANETLEKAINQAQCQFIYDFEEGLKTQIGERGVRLSGGQKQRLAIAKLFLKNPKIIILDEPTSALDSFSEEEVTKALNNLFKGRTVIVAAHRLQTVKTADQILVLDDGEIVEKGTHEELIEGNGFYKKMLDLQSGF